MNEEQVVSQTPIPSTIEQLRLDRILESKTNPRRVFDEAMLRELADNIKVHGSCKQFSHARPLMAQTGHRRWSPVPDVFARPS